MTARDIYTVAGNGTPGFSGDGGPATHAELGGPGSVAVDPAGNLVIADSPRIRVVAKRTGTFYGQEERKRWGGWDSNPGPPGYESSLPATRTVGRDLGRQELARSWLSRFGHVLGMIKLDTDEAVLSDLAPTRLNLGCDASA